jgi:hypothetical protein
MVPAGLFNRTNFKFDFFCNCLFHNWVQRNFDTYVFLFKFFCVLVSSNRSSSALSRSSRSNIAVPAEGCGQDDDGLEVRIPKGAAILSTASRPLLWSIQYHIHWVPGDLSVELKRSRREVDYQSASNLEVKVRYSYTSNSSYTYVRSHGVVLNF